MSSEDESSDDVPLAELISGMRGNSPELGEVTPKTVKNTKQKKRRKKKDPNEPQKPISAYALFFRDTQAAIKGQNPNASFGEVSKIVASMWDGLEPDAKNVYKKTAEAAKKEYAKALSIYKAKMSQSGEQSNLGKTSLSSSPTRKSSDEEENDREDGEGSFEENQVSSKVINLADSPELTGGNDANKLDKESKQSSGGIMSSDEDDEPLKKPSDISKSAEDSSVANAPSSNAVQQQSEMKPPMNGDVVDADEIQQICLRNGCENLAIDSPEWDKEYCSSECVVVHCRDVFNAWVAAKKMSPTY